MGGDLRRLSHSPSCHYQKIKVMLLHANIILFLDRRFSEVVTKIDFNYIISSSHFLVLFLSYEF